MGLDAARGVDGLLAAQVEGALVDAIRRCGIGLRVHESHRSRVRKVCAAASITCACTRAC